MEDSSVTAMYERGCFLCVDGWSVWLQPAEGAGRKGKRAVSFSVLTKSLFKAG
jgi:hypothetical protein